MSLVERAQRGDAAARDRLLALCAAQAARIASRAVGHYIQAGRDEEMSVALMAVNEAVDRFDPARGRRFLLFAEKVIRRRLVDYLRVRPPVETPFSDLEKEDDDGHVYVPVLAHHALELAAVAGQDEARREEVVRYGQRLREFGLSLDELSRVSPRHADARRDAMAVGRMVANDERLLGYVLKRRTLPLKTIAERVRLSRKTLERHRKYILAVALVSRTEFPCLYSYMPEAGAPA